MEKTIIGKSLIRNHGNKQMEIVGGGSITELGLKDELHHEPSGHEMWQDSVVLCWWDLKNHVGGYHRIGHHPHHPNGPRAHLTNNFFSADCIYKRCEFIPLHEGDNTATRFSSGDGTCTFEFTDHAIWTFSQPEVSGQLHVHDYHPPVDIYPKQGQVAAQIAAGHLEVGAGISGSIKLNGKDYNIEGLAFRDHGWGIRYWDSLVSHRWIAGTFGPDLTILAVSILPTDDNLVSFGCVIRDNTLTYAKVDIVTYMECDSMTHRGGHLRMELTTGEVMEIEAVPLQKGAVSWMADTMSTTDTICKLIYGDRVGICDFEISTNPGRGSHRAMAAVNGITTDGLHIF